jgi:superfamily II DNA or RNA helicase
MSDIRITVSDIIEAEGLPQDLWRSIVRDLTLPNPEYVTLERLGKWTGDTPDTVTLARQRGDVLLLPRGYIDTLLQRVRAAGDLAIIEDRRLKLPVLDLTLHGELYSYQAKALRNITQYGSGLLVAPCGSGKTALGMAIIAHWKQPALILVHTHDLVRQTCDAVRQWLNIEPGVISEGKCSFAHVTVATVQTLHSRPEILEEARGRFGLVMQDEAHRAPARTFTEVLQQFPAILRYGLTATPERRDGLSPFMTAVIGPERYTITNEDLRRAGVLVTPRIEWIRTEFFSYSPDWADLMREIVENEPRNNLIVNVILRALDDGRRIIALSERVEHVKSLTARINRIRPGAAVLATGSVKARERIEAMRKIGTGEAQVLFATKIADEGLNIPALDALVLLTPSRDGGKTTQRVGRVLRAVPGKPAPVVYDLIDANVGMLANQARCRFFGCYQTLAPGQRLPNWLDSRTRVA